MRAGWVGRLRRRRTATAQTTVGDCAVEELLLRQEKLFCCGSKLTGNEKSGFRRPKTHPKTDLVICLDLVGGGRYAMIAPAAGELNLDSAVARGCF